MDMSIRFPGLNLVLDHVPRSFEIFGFEITIYGVLIAIGMLLGIFFVVLEARRNHEDPDAYLDLAIITLLSGVAGARLLYAAFSWSLYKNDPGQLLNIRSGEVTTAMREKLQTVDGGTWILVQPLFFYESLWCLLVLLVLMMLLRKKVFQGEIFLRYLAGYGLGRAVLQWFRTDKILFPGTSVDVSLVISVILFVLCTVVVAVKRVMSRKRAKVRMRRIEKDQQAEKEAEQQRENAAENLETETVQGEKNGSERDTEERGSSSESVTFAAAAGGTEEAGQPDQEQERSSEESGGQPKS